MNLKRFALKGLALLAAAVALCMFFANTVQSITTPKVRLAKPQKGKMEQTISLKAKAHFPGSQPCALTEAIGHNLLVNRVYVRPGYPVKKGDLLFSGVLPDYEEAMEKLRVEYDKKAAELAKKDVENRKRKKESTRTSRYQAMMNARAQLSAAKVRAQALAINRGVDLTSELEHWTYAAAADEALLRAVRAALDAKAVYDEAEAAFFETYKRSSLSISSELYNYILERNALIDEMDGLEAQMAALEAAKEKLENVVAERDGTIVSVSVKEGETYDGKKAAYEMDDPERPPVLRAYLENVKKAIEAGSRAVVKGEYDEVNTTVSETGVDEEGNRYVDLALTDELLEARGGLYALIGQGELDASLSFRASQSSTLIPASALRSENGEDFVFLVEQRGGGLTGTHMELRKRTVTVLDKSDKTASIAEDLTGLSIADREDRSIEDGARVMEYID